MGKKNSRKIIDEIVDGTISATECTGALQQINLDPKEVARFHAIFTGEE